MTSTAVELHERAFLHIAGPDALEFLDNVITNDIQSLTSPGESLHGGLLTPQGKILFAFFVIRLDDGFLLDTTASQIDDLAKRLTMYRLRAKAEITDQTAAWAVSVTAPAQICDSAKDADATDAATGFTITDPRNAALGQRHYRQRSQSQSSTNEPVSEVAASTYHDLRVATGIAELGADYESATTFPHEANWDQDGSVNFSKGCFIGQEVVSRARHKTVARKRFVKVLSDQQATTQHMTTGADVTAGAATIGTVGTVSSDGRTALAIIRLDRAVEALSAGTPITSDGKQLVIDPAVLADYRERTKQKAAQ